MQQVMKNQLFTLKYLKREKSLPEIYAVTSGKGGVGKTSISVNIAILLSKLRKKVLLVDADIHLGNVDLVLGIRPRYTIEDVIRGTKQLKDIIVRSPGNIDVLPASSAVLDLLEMEEEVITRLGAAFESLEHQYDMVIVDTGAGISNNVLSFVFGADKIIVVVTSDPASIADSYGMIKIITLTKPSAPILMVANMVSSEAEGESLFQKIELMTRRFLNTRIWYGGAIIRSAQVAHSVRNQLPIALDQPNTAPVNAMRLITRNIVRTPRNEEKRQSSFFSGFLTNRDINIGDIG